MYDREKEVGVWGERAGERESKCLMLGYGEEIYYYLYYSTRTICIISSCNIIL